MSDIGSTAVGYFGWNAFEASALARHCDTEPLIR